MKTYFVADAHLGALYFDDIEAHNHRFINFLEHISADAKQLFILGDLFDFWFEFPHRYPKGYDDVLETLKKTTQKGITIHFFGGNHDSWSWGKLTELTGVIFHETSTVMRIDGHTFFLAHGHGLGREGGGARLINYLFKSKICKELFRYLVPYRLGCKFGFKWSASNRKKHIQKRDNCINYYESQQNDYNNYPQVKWAKEYLQQTSTEFVVMGHLHKEVNILTGDNRQIVILDEFYNRYGYAVFDGSRLWCENFVD